MLRLYLLFGITTMFLSCGAGDDTGLPQSRPLSGDSIPPVFQDSWYNDSGTYCLIFDEEVFLVGETALEPDGAEWEISDEGKEIRFRWTGSPDPAEEYRLSLNVKDSSGNSNWFIVPFWSPNPNQAVLKINEVNPNGSGNNPDCLEFYCTAGGSLKGLTLYLGTSRESSASFSFPDLEVEQGDYLILHCRPEGLPEEKNEITDKTLSGGLLASDEAWDLWVDEDMGLPGTNALLCLVTLPFDGEISDCLVYTNRQENPSEEDLGWTSALYKQLQTLPEGVWEQGGDMVSPAEAVWGDDSTGTRSLCRSSVSEDSDSRSDWHTVPTGMKSFGSVNSDEVYSP